MAIAHRDYDMHKLSGLRRVQPNLSAKQATSPEKSTGATPILRNDRAACLFCKADAGELPARMRGEEISISRPDVCDRGCARSAAQNELIAHKLAVIFAQLSGQRLITWIRRIRALRPLPNIAVELLRNASAGFGGDWVESIVLDEIAAHRRASRRNLPLGLGGQ